MSGGAPGQSEKTSGQGGPDPAEWRRIFLALADGGSERERIRAAVSAVTSIAPSSVSGAAIKSEDGSEWTLLAREGQGEIRDAQGPAGDELQRILRQSADGWLRLDGSSSLCQAFQVGEGHVVPVSTGHRAMGVLFVGSRSEAALSHGQREALTLLSNQLAIGLENLRLRRKLERFTEIPGPRVKERRGDLHHSEDRLRVLLEVNNAVVSELDRQALFRSIAEALRSLLPFHRATLALLQGDGSHLQVLSLTSPGGNPTFQAEGGKLSVEGSVAGQVIRTSQPVIRHDLEKEAVAYEERMLREKGVRSYVSVPLVSKTKVLGLMALGSRSPGVYSDDDALFLTEVGKQVALGLDNMLAYEEVQELRRKVELEAEYLREEVLEAHAFGEIIGRSPAIRKIEEAVEQVAPTEATVLVTGESGTGKELVAREIHARSERRDHPLIKVNCAAVPRELYESEFFGHVKGAFSGAVRDRAGRFEAADRGTLFLDEVGEIPLELQSKLLMVLQDGTYQRVGEERVREVDVRIIAATNRPLEQEVDAGRFRKDLFYRLAVFPIEVPPLRERRSDIPLLAQHFVEQLSGDSAGAGLNLSRANVRNLQAYDWPGNVRELRNYVERAVIRAPSLGGRLVFDLPGSGDGPPVTEGGREEFYSSEGEPTVLTEREIRQREVENLKAALDRSGGKVYGKGGAAELLGLPPTTLSSRLKRLGIRSSGG